MIPSNIKITMLNLLKRWIVGDDLGTNVGYAMVVGENQCPEDSRGWEWWSFSTGQWVTDDNAYFECA